MAGKGACFIGLFEEPHTETCVSEADLILAMRKFNQNFADVPVCCGKHRTA